MSSELLNLAPVPDLLRRVRSELSADFPGGKTMRLSRAPGRLDVMGGIADYTGATVCEWPLDRAAAVATQQREDRELQVFSFNLLDEHLPFTLRIPLDALADASADELRREFNEPGRKFAGYLAGCLFLLHERGHIDLRDPRHPGLNLALLSDVPIGAGVSSSAAIEVATMMNLVGHFDLDIDGLSVAGLCQEVENRIVGAPCGLMDQVTACLGNAGEMLRMRCQPHDLLPPLRLPDEMRVMGLNSNVRHSVASGASGIGPYERSRCAAFMGHRIILEKMRDLGRAANKELLSDPTRGYLANLEPPDYKRFFRMFLPEEMKGSDFIARFGPTHDAATIVRPDETYRVQQAVDHHVIEARRIRDFAEFIEQSHHAPAGTRERGLLLDKAGHLMYASHISYTNDALLGAPECDLLVKLARDREKQGIYGAKITGGGSGGTVALLLDRTEAADRAVSEIVEEYRFQTAKTADVLSGTSPGAWHVKSTLVQG